MYMYACANAFLTDLLLSLNSLNVALVDLIYFATIPESGQEIDVGGPILSTHDISVYFLDHKSSHLILSWSN
jgi:hypothetical protein